MPAAAESKFFNSSSVGIAIMYRIVITYLLVLLLPFGICAQTADFVPEWKVEAQKIADGQYRLRFSTELSNGWQLYAPDQVLLDVPVAQLQFSDSSISVDPKIRFTPAATTISSELFGQPVSIQQGAIQWESVITITGPVPAFLLGQLFFTYGKDDVFYPSTTFSFQVPLEGGQSAVLSPKENLSLQSPVADCGDESPGSKS